ncbi:hypothetical protein HY991_01035 [Candidatus Micrarchaeota archaeon]|nr:hypothetical protein [Candidatus Micrarchaeota archaeon]
MMKKKILCTSAIVIGVSLLILGLFQLNQYITTSAIVQNYKSTLSNIASSAPEAEQLLSTLGEAPNSILLSMLTDFGLGAILLILGTVLYPER